MRGTSDKRARGREKKDIIFPSSIRALNNEIGGGLASTRSKAEMGLACGAKCCISVKLQIFDYQTLFYYFFFHLSF
jgi:hypothetical protein